jgi:hypothetical protein
MLTAPSGTKERLETAFLIMGIEWTALLIKGIAETVELAKIAVGGK